MITMSHLVTMSKQVARFMLCWNLNIFIKQSFVFLKLYVKISI